MIPLLSALAITVTIVSLGVWALLEEHNDR
jgi:hypothetical protein